MLFLLLAVLILSCGGGQGSGPKIELSFKGVVDAPYFTTVEVRVSGEEFEPLMAKRTGIFFPGDVVEFDIPIPEGSERLFEATVYDNLGNPVYYGAKTTDVNPGSRIVIELHPSSAKVYGLLRYIDTEVPTEIELFKVNEDLYTGFGPEKTGDEPLDTYLIGSYVAYVDKDRSVRYTYSYSLSDIFLYKEDTKSFSVEIPQGEAFLYLTGSYEGGVSPGDNISVPTGRLFSDGSLVLSGIGEGIYTFFGVPQEGVVIFNHSTCLTLTEPDCLPLKLGFSGLMPERVEIYGVYNGVRFLASTKDHFWYSPDIDYRLKVYGTLGTENCIYNWSLERELPEGFNGEGELFIDTLIISVPEGISGGLRIYGEGIELEGFCEGIKEIKVPVFDTLPPETYLELEKAGRKVGALVEGKEVVFPKLDIREILAELRENTLFFKFIREGELGECELLLEGESYKLFIDRIPPWRSYIKLKDLMGIDLKDKFEEGIFYRLKCYSNDGKAYVSVEPLESIGVF